MKENATVEFFKARSLATRSTLESVTPPVDDSGYFRSQKVID